MLLPCSRIPGEDLRVREIRISCPDVTGLGVDIFRVLLDFGLRVLGADFSTDGSWCFLVLVVTLSPGTPSRWALLKARLQEVVPTEADNLRKLCPSTPKSRQPYAIHISGSDRKGMLHSMTHALWEADLAMIKAHVTTTAFGEVRDTFFVFDNRDELPHAHRILEICDRVKGALAALGSDVDVEIEQAATSRMSETSRTEDDFSHGNLIKRVSCKDVISDASLRAIVSRKKLSTSSDDDRHSPDLGSCPETVVGHGLEVCPSQKRTEVAVEVDNTTSQTSTLLTLRCKDRKGLLYDLFVALKDVAIRVTYGRVAVDTTLGRCIVDLFVQDTDYNRIMDEDLLNELTERVRLAAALPVRIEVADADDGEAMEVTIAANVDAGGRGRPRVTFDVTQGLCAAGVDVCFADIFVDDKEQLSPDLGASAQEIHRFLVHLPEGSGSPKERSKHDLLEVVQACLTGTRPAIGISCAGEAVGAQLLQPSARSPALVRTMSDAWKGA